MKGVRFTKAEQSVIEDALNALTEGFGAIPAKHPIHSIRAKIRAAVEAPSGVSVKPVEDKLIKASRGKVVALLDGHAVASRRLTAMKVTAEQAEMVGEWMSRQSWLSSPMTILDVLNKWFSWLPKAQSTAPPPVTAPGFGNEKSAHGATGTGSGGGNQRPAPGFGRGR